LYAQWNATVTYNANGAVATAPTAVLTTGSASRTFNLNSGTGLTKPNLNFTGWNTKADGTGLNYLGSSSYTATGDITLYAILNQLIPITLMALLAELFLLQLRTSTWVVLALLMLAIQIAKFFLTPGAIKALLCQVISIRLKESLLKYGVQAAADPLLITVILQWRSWWIFQSNFNYTNCR
jgi:hypothetical protein